jgi:hypothetical protein
MEPDLCYICYNEETSDNMFLHSDICNCGQTYRIHTKCFSLLQNKISCSICKQEYRGIDKLTLRSSNGLRLIVEFDNLGFRNEYTVDDQDMKHGFHKIWYHNGNLWEENYYEKGLRQGLQKLYSVNGELYREMHYQNGNRV